MKFMTQKFADAYSEVGSRQVLVSVYLNEAILYAQVSEATAGAIQARLTYAVGFRLVEGPARSADGLTWCWSLRGTSQVPEDFLPYIMVRLNAILLKACPDLVDDLNYTDNRHLDANTLEAFASALGDA